MEVIYTVYHHYMVGREEWQNSAISIDAYFIRQFSPQRN